MELALNELSYSLNWPVDKSMTLYDTFFGIYLSLNKHFKKKIILKYSKQNGHNEVIFRYDTNFLKWFSSQEKDNKSSILSILTGGQFIIDYPYYKVFGEEGQGIAYAHENEELLLSFQSDDKWKVNYLDLIEERLNDEKGEIESQELKIRNSHDEESKNLHLAFLSNRFGYHNNEGLKKLKARIIRGGLLWEQRSELFPSLIFCASTEEYIQNIQSGSVLENLLTRLYEYDTYFNNWVDGDFDRSKVGGDPRLESDTRINKYSELNARCPEGQNRLFSFHCNYGIGGGRMHFLPDYDTRKCIIGYIGKKIV